MSRSKPTAAERTASNEARERLRELLPPGTTVYTVLRHVSRSGMMRHIDAYVMRDSEPWYLSGLIYTANIGVDSGETASGALKIPGCGMDAGFHLVYSLSRALYRDGFACIQIGDDPYRIYPRCPGNDHVNAGECRNNTHHSDGGYALKHRWM